MHCFRWPMTLCHFWDLHCLKIIYFAQCPSYHVSQWPLISKNKIQNILNPNAHNVPYVIFLFFDIVCNVLKLQCLNAPYCPKRKFSCPTQSPLCFNVYVQHTCHCLLLFCHSLSTFSSFCCPPSFAILGVVFRCVFIVDKT